MKVKKTLTLILIFLCCSYLMNAQNYNVDSLKQQLASTKENIKRADLLSLLARIYNFSYPDTAESYAKQGLQLARKINYTQGEATCMMVLCLSMTFSGDYTNALDYGLKASPLLTDLHDTLLLVWNSVQIMTCYRLLEDYDQALMYGYKAKKLLKSFHADSNQVSVVFGVIGAVYKEKNQLDSALYYEQKAFASDTSWSQVFQYMGDIYIKSGQKNLALNYYKRGLRVTEHENNSIGFVGLNNGISKVFELTGQIDSAIFYSNKSIQQPAIKNNAQGLLEASTQLARLYEMQGKPDSTIKYLKAENTLKDSLYNRKKTREAQNFAFKEALHQQDIIAQQQKDNNKIKVAVLLSIIFIFLLVAFFLWRNNQQKRFANILLQQQKEKVESTLSELKSTQAQLIQSEKMASLGELTAGIAHEIQNPLNFVNNFSEVNKELIGELVEEVDKGNTDEVKAIANDIRDNEEKINQHGKRADAIVKGMLQHSRQTKGLKEPTDINALCDEYLRLSYHGLRAKDKSFNADFKTEFDENIGKINIVPQDIGRVLLNLFNNAFYAVNEKSRRSTVNSPQLNANYKPLVLIQTKKQNDKIEIRVTDNGNGIPQSIIDKIFQPFFTTKPTGQGTGLGLSLAYDIITKEHNGILKVESKEDEGTTFIIQLPITA